MSSKKSARRFLVRGRVQGVGFRNFVQLEAERLRLEGYARNLDDGRVEVYATGSEAQLSELSGLLWKGPRWSEVYGVDASDAAVESCSGFYIRQ